MTIDERLEALTHSVELLTLMQIESEKRIQRLLEVHTQLEQSIIRLVNIAVRHEERLDDLEGNRPQ